MYGLRRRRLGRRASASATRRRRGLRWRVARAVQWCALRGRVGPKELGDAVSRDGAARAPHDSQSHASCSTVNAISQPRVTVTTSPQCPRRRHHRKRCARRPARGRSRSITTETKARAAGDVERAAAGDQQQQRCGGSISSSTCRDARHSPEPDRGSGGLGLAGGEAKCAKLPHGNRCLRPWCVGGRGAAAP